VVVEHQDPLARPPRPLPGLEPGAERFAKRFSPEPARLVSLKSALEVAERQHETTLACLRLAAPERLSRLERRERLGEAAKTAQRQRLAAERDRRAGRRGARLEIGVERFLGAIELQTGVAKVDRRLGEVLAQRKRAASRVERLLEPSKLAQRAGAARPGVGIVWRELRRRFERRKSLSEAARTEIELAGIDMGDD
jgi:hypothetical protein